MIAPARCLAPGEAELKSRKKLPARRLPAHASATATAWLAVTAEMMKSDPAASSAALPASDLLRAIKGADKANIVAARVFDDFRGAGVPEGKKSLAIEVTLQPGEKSFTDAELKAVSDKVVAAAAKLGADLRG